MIYPLQYLLEHFGVGIAAITGVLAARGKRVDLFGVVVLALVTAFGGGTIRDLMLGDAPVFWVRKPEYAINAFITAVAVFYLVRYHELPDSVLLVADAVVLAFFTMIGVRKAMSFDVASSISVAMGVITGVAGGMVRDIMLGEMPLVFRQGTCLYATAAFFGATLYVCINQWWPDAWGNLLVATLSILLLRLAGIQWKLTLPVLRPKQPPASAGE